MSADEDLDLLLHRHLDGSLDAEASRALNARLTSDPKAAQRLALFAVDQTELRQALQVGEIGSRVRAPQRKIEKISAAPAVARPAGRPGRFIYLAAGAAAVLVFAAGAWMFFGGGESGPALESGQLLVDGAPSNTPNEGKLLEAVGGPAVVRLRDGSRIELSEESVARLKVPVDGLRQLVSLEEGEGRFKVTHGGGQFRVETPAGHVTVLGTEFTIRVPKKHGKLGKELAEEAAPICVNVQTGRVQVEHNGRTIMLVGGQSFNGEGEVRFAQNDPKKRPPGAAANGKTPEKAPAKEDAIEVTGILHAAFGAGPDPVPEFMTITTPEATVYKVEIDATATALARDFDGQEVTVTGTLRANNGVEWFTLTSAPGAGVEKLHTDDPKVPQAVEGKDDKPRKRPELKGKEGDKKIRDEKEKP